ncbi:hypothetical protein BX285_3576 [Streptomyces sp. 1114.5]|uniref:hypothetical protein n=1 Tax=Streptomyces sp. 1114.5 TaxID=1938830 RepID=UPI000F1EB811|nr:hypothetical protein [Streptomyces sp. 1114.5]RKT19124.1 hypothetical protein BX285_3576 [Streptomyces sp. 1114.5]
MTATPSPNPHPVTPELVVDQAFEQELCELVLDTAPRLFAVVQVSDEGLADADGWVVAWGFANGDGSAHVIGIDGRARLTLSSPDRAVRHFAGRPGITSRLIWLAQPGAATTSRAEAA